MNLTQVAVLTVHYLLQDKVPLSVKLNQLLSWIDLPSEERPQLLMGAYDYDIHEPDSLPP